MLNKKSLSEQVYELIKKEIILDNLKPGEKLSVEKISKHLNVSRTPVSNALQALERDGYVEIVPQSGTYVRELSLEEIKAIYELREEIEGLVAKIAINKVDSKILEDYLQKFHQFLIKEEVNEEVLLDYFQLDLELHDYLLRFCPQIIQKETRNIIDLTKRSRRLCILYELKEKSPKDLIKKEIRNHREIIDAFLEKDLDKAIYYSKRDVREAKEQVLKFFYLVQEESYEAVKEEEIGGWYN
ncbi:GntR family transcriptional regulator [Ammoniphilus resinae]|uniref:DNA-binding GntR family transcriptional regulator n=1 Tax=Ammoniphilus resinae TaxID=861532 RepID=A0ABS4GT71_9BACL|nr:GntR family transcriptional regulator [Ammoniphilus resinae]MBP1933327.1 DNA-binding GntR family transcriptional regulator [Ammoniphilus resinae]